MQSTALGEFISLAVQVKYGHLPLSQLFQPRGGKRVNIFHGLCLLLDLFALKHTDLSHWPRITISLDVLELRKVIDDDLEAGSRE